MTRIRTLCIYTKQTKEKKKKRKKKEKKEFLLLALVLLTRPAQGRQSDQTMGEIEVSANV